MFGSTAVAFMASICLVETSLVITGMRGAKAGVSPLRRSLVPGTRYEVYSYHTSKYSSNYLVEDLKTDDIAADAYEMCSK